MNSKAAAKAFAFYAIALSLAIAVRLSVPAIGEASPLVTMLTPAIAAGVMLAWVAPEGGFRQAVTGLGLATAGLKGWPLAIGGPVLIFGGGLAVLVATGLTTLAPPAITGSTGAAVLRIGAGLVIGTVLALGEEVGWRGYMLPRLAGFGMVGAMLVVGLLHGIWHLPLLLTTDYYHAGGNPWIVTPLFLITLTLAGVFYGFLRVWTGSVWPVAIAHASANMAWAVSAEVTQARSPMVLEYLGGESGMLTIFGLLIFDTVLIRAMWTSRTGSQALGR